MVFQGATFWGQGIPCTWPDVMDFMAVPVTDSEGLQFGRRSCIETGFRGQGRVLSIASQEVVLQEGRT